MKIGILTFHRALNYGAVLQCYALQETLKGIGHEVEVIDYRPSAIEDYYRVFKINGKIRSLLSSIYHSRTAVRCHKNFKSFRDKYLKMSEKSFNSRQELPELSYDAIIIGSDQVWSLDINNGFDSLYWGDFPTKAIKIAYAASMGLHNSFTKEEVDKIKKFLGAFHSISVREDTLQEELRNAIGSNDIRLVLDPTLIAKDSDYDKITIKPDCSNYILFYQLTYNPKARSIVSQKAKELKCKVIIIAGVKEQYEVETEWHHESEISVPKFLGLIKYARFVFTTSFHGTAFSIIFQKEFMFVGNYSIDRPKSLLRSLGLLDRMISENPEAVKDSIDYQNVNAELSKMRENSLSFIKDSLC